MISLAYAIHGASVLGCSQFVNEIPAIQISANPMHFTPVINPTESRCRIGVSCIVSSLMDALLSGQEPRRDHISLPKL